jgi:ketosteroid isomerase-like protein
MSRSRGVSESGSGLSDLARLADERELCEAMNRYARALDARDWPRLDAVFAPDAVALYKGDAPRLGRAVIVESIRGYLDGCGPSQHLLGNFSARVDGDRAETRTYGRVYHRGRGQRAHLSLETFGEYLVRWERRPEGWRAVRWELDIWQNVGDLSVLGP